MRPRVSELLTSSYGYITLRPDSILTMRIFALILLSSLAAIGQPQPAFWAGAATANITPPLGSPIVGNWDDPPATYVHDELHARALVLDDGQTKLVFVVCDNVGISRDVYDSAK